MGPAPPEGFQHCWRIFSCWLELSLHSSRQEAQLGLYGCPSLAWKSITLIGEDWQAVLGAQCLPFNANPHCPTRVPPPHIHVTAAMGLDSWISNKVEMMGGSRLDLRQEGNSPMEPKQHYGMGRKKVTQTKNCEGPQKCRQSQKGPILMSLLAVPPKRVPCYFPGFSHHPHIFIPFLSLPHSRREWHLAAVSLDFLSLNQI